VGRFFWSWCGRFGPDPELVMPRAKELQRKRVKGCAEWGDVQARREAFGRLRYALLMAPDGGSMRPGR